MSRIADRALAGLCARNGDDGSSSNGARAVS
jgi:hypothetical protein